MAKVSKCDCRNCSYNLANTCHALAVTIGDDDNQRCDTFCEIPVHGGDPQSIAGVGACKVASCMYNVELECRASGILVGFKAGEPDCLTFRTR